MAECWLKKLEEYDVIIGSIADDRMVEAVKEFSTQRITDKVLEACLLSANYGLQYVLKTDFACSKVEILAQKELTGFELFQAQQYASQKRNDSIGIIDKMVDKYIGQGSYLYQVITEEEEKLEARYQEDSLNLEQEEDYER